MTRHAFGIELTSERRQEYKERMKKQLSHVAVLLGFAFSTLVLLAFAQAQQGGQEQNNKSKAKQAKPEKSQPNDAKSEAKFEKKQGKEQVEMRFRGLDRNQDGTISRCAWRRLAR